MLQRKVSYKYESLLSTSLGIQPGLELLDYKVILCLAVWGTTKLFSTALTPFCTPTSNLLGFQFLHIFANVFYFIKKIIAILEGGKWHLTVILICISLTATFQFCLNIPPRADLKNSFYKGADSKYSRHYEPYSLFHNYLTLLL